MARYQTILAYDGTGFAGSQRQANARTVQGEFEKALHGLGWTGKTVLLAGRTDSGVHASGQVVSFDLEWRHSNDALLKALNGNLPADMAAQSVEVAKDDFHPRFDASAREYEYHLFFAPVRNPLRERYAWRIWPRISEDKLLQAASVLMGTHDFADFGTPPRAETSTIRTIRVARWVSQGDELVFTVRSEAFLYRMVRKMTFVQVAVGQDRFSVDELAGVLAGGSTEIKLPGGLAPAAGLTLVKVFYPEYDEIDSSLSL